MIDAQSDHHAGISKKLLCLRIYKTVKEVNNIKKNKTGTFIIRCVKNGLLTCVLFIQIFLNKK